MSYHLFLDDQRNLEDVHWIELPQSDAWRTVRSYKEFCHVINTFGMPDFIAYDCDLCDEHYEAYFNLRHAYPLHYKKFKNKCGIDCIDWLLEYCKEFDLKHPPFVAHTKNHYAKGFMENLIQKFNER